MRRREFVGGHDLEETTQPVDRSRIERSTCETAFPPPVGLPVDSPPWDIRKVASHTLRRRETLGVNENSVDDAVAMDGVSFKSGLR